MVVKDVNRRKSVAVAGHNTQQSLPRHRRRAHSGISDLSPLARSRLSGPFKGILKSALKPARISAAASQSSTEGSQTPASQETGEAEDATQSMDFTQDYQALVHDNAGRKSMGRRVSFNQRAFVRIFDEADNGNSTSSPQSSPAQASDIHEPAANNDENAYSRAALAQRRRSSGRASFASDMDLTGIAGTSTLKDETLSDMSDMDLDVTDVARRQPFPTADPLTDKPVQEGHLGFSDDSITFSDDLSQAHSDASQQMEFTVPLAQALRPAAQDATWLELQKATHAGDASPIDDDTGSTSDEALRGRPSLGFGEHSFSSTEDSFEDGSDAGDKTLNLSKVIARASMGGRMSDAFTEMDESEIYGQMLPPSQPGTSQPIVPESTQTTAPLSSVYLSDPLQGEQSMPVFQPPPASPFTRPDTTHSRLPVPSTNNTFSKPRPPVFSAQKTPAPSHKPIFRPPSPVKDSNTALKSPSKTPAKKFTAAFAPPTTRPSPKKSLRMTLKRPLPPDENVENGRTPAKRAANFSQPQPDNSVSLPSNKVPTPVRPISPSKKAPFEPVSNGSSLSNARRPSGYFARRRSIAVSEKPSEEMGITMPSLTTPKAPTHALSRGRASVGADIADAMQTCQRDLPSIPAMNNPPNQPSQKDEPTRDSPTPVSSSFVVPTDETLNEGIPSSIQGMELGDLPEVDADAATEAWRQNVDPTEPDEGEDDTPAITIEQFFEMTGIKFMDDLQAPRRSMHTSHPRQSRHSGDIPLADQALALVIDLPQLSLYSRISSDLQAWMQQSKAIFSEAEEEAAKMTPELFVEYARADADGQAELLHQLELIRTNTRGLAKSDWYDWKLQWVEGLRITAEQALGELELDATAVADLRSQADNVLPALQNEYDTLQRELEMEQAEVAEIEKCDQEYLGELKASITEQNIVVESLQAEVKEEQDQVEWLQERLSDLELEKAETTTAISEAKRILHMQSNSTEAEVFKLRDDLQALESIHRFRITRIATDVFEYVFCSQYLVHIPCENFAPVNAKTRITQLDYARQKHKDPFPALSSVILFHANDMVRRSRHRDVRTIVQQLSDYWSSYYQLRVQLKHLCLSFDAKIVPTASSPASFAVKVPILYPSQKASAVVSYMFDDATFARWPCSISALRYDVEILYGDLNRNLILQSLAQTLSCKSPAENYACLNDACLEAARIL